jgi:ketosteroid isomerase-like protein
MIPDRIRDHAAGFNAAVRSGDFGPFVQTFTDDAVMRFVGVPAGPFVGRAAIAQAYATQPPADTLSVEEVSTEADVDVVRFRWDGGGVGTFTVRWHDGLVADLTVSFG